MKRFITLLITSLLLIGCTSEPEPATPITWEQVGGDMVNRRVSLEGTLMLPNSIMATDTMLLHLIKDPEAEEPTKVSISTKIGSGKNQVEKLPKKYQESDFKLHSNTGDLIPVKSKVRVSGKLIGDSKAWILMGPLVIEKL